MRHAVSNSCVPALRSKVPVSSQHDFSVLLVTAGKSELPYMSIRNDVEGCT